MNSRAQIRMLPDGRRSHLHDGPIDIILEAFGTQPEITKAYRAATIRFSTVLDELCSELTVLRTKCCPEGEWPHGRVARRMTAAVMPYATEYFITPMAAVAGAVAEEILASMVEAANLSRAYANNGGDIAFHLSPGESFAAGMVERPERPWLLGSAKLRWDDPVRGIATSGWRGRSFSLGIADAVTVLADRASVADAAATIIANAVNLPGHPAIVRVPACELAPDSDLGYQCVTQAVGKLSVGDVEAALASGSETAARLLKIGLIRSAALHLQGETRVVGAGGDSALVSTSKQERILLHA
jgi:ApbE superfamily uncharacterized protein (UPF0280 family)